MGKKKRFKSYLEKINKRKPTYKYGDISLKMIEDALKEMYEKNPPKERDVKIHFLSKESYDLFQKAVEEEFKKQQNEI